MCPPAYSTCIRGPQGQTQAICRVVASARLYNSTVLCSPVPLCFTVPSLYCLQQAVLYRARLSELYRTAVRDACTRNFVHWSSMPPSELCCIRPCRELLFIACVLTLPHGAQRGLQCTIAESFRRRPRPFTATFTRGLPRRWLRHYPGQRLHREKVYCVHCFVPTLFFFQGVHYFPSFLAGLL